MKSHLSLPVILLCILAGVLSACNAAPQEALNAWQQALNDGDIDRALSYLAEDATVTVAPAFEGDGVYEGQTEIRGWYEMLASAKGAGSLSNCAAQGETITCLNTYTDAGLKSLGVDFLEGDFVAVVRDGKIQSYTVTTRPESLAKFPPAPEAQTQLVALAPEEIANAWTQALAVGDIEAALSYLAEDAAVAIVPSGPDGDGAYNGHAEIRGWYETITAARGVGNLSNCMVDGENITCLNTYADEGLKSMGVDFIEGEWAAVIRDGKIYSYTFTITPASLAKFPPPPEAEPAAPTPAPETRLTSAEALVGNWEGKSGEYNVLHQFQPDGTVGINVSGVGLISTSRYWFEDGLLKFEDMTGDCQGIVGSYEVYATYNAEAPVQLRFVLVGGDACSDRKRTLAGKSMFPAQNPPEASISETEMLATQPADILGAWQGKIRGEAILLYFYDDGTFAVKWPDSKLWIARGKYSFDDTQLVVEDETCGSGTWKVYVTGRNGAPAKLRFELVSDACEDRKTQFLEAPHVRYET